MGILEDAVCVLGEDTGCYGMILEKADCMKGHTRGGRAYGGSRRCKMYQGESTGGGCIKENQVPPSRL